MEKGKNEARTKSTSSSSIHMLRADTKKFGNWIFCLDQICREQRITFVLITRLASDRFKLSHYVNGITMGTLSQISDAIRGIKDLKSVSITKVEAGDLR
jgi:hypothetical protein